MTRKQKSYKELETENTRGIVLETVISLLDYNPDTGEFKWKNPWHPNCLTGWFKGVLNVHGYYVLLINKKLYLAHRIAWALYYKEWPSQVIDHINQDKTCNQISNLRDVSFSLNALNSSIPHRKSVSGILGVHWDKKRNKWKTSVRVKDKVYNLGRFDTIEEAKIAYDKEKSKHV